MDRARPSGRLQAGAALLAWLATLAVFWPGIALYDSVDQYGQLLSGDYADWHPPIMARFWSLFASWWPGAAPMLLVQTAFYWLGIGLLAAACARRGKGKAGWALLAIGAFFLSSCWLGAILKDGQMVGATLATTGMVGWYRLEEKRLPWWAAAPALSLLAYALLVRANAMFAVVPLAMILFGWGPARRPIARICLGTAAIVGAMLLAPPINHYLLGAEASGVERSQLIYDLTGIGARTVDPVAGYKPEAWQPRKCYSLLEWDRAGEGDCPGAEMLYQPSSRLARLWIGAILSHPLAYAAHRIAHFNFTMRLFVPANLPHSVSPVAGEPNRLGLATAASRAEIALHRAGLWLSALPIAWPCLWLALDLVAFWSAVTAPPGAFRDLAFALSLSALALGASFLAISVASDLRYHLWTMIAAAMAFPMLWAAGALNRRHLIVAAGLAAAIAIVGTGGRMLLPAFA
ncbi:MAG: hypothetical protein JWP15_166 [Alphaproteobacteria bacterium]|nr:hypothetical protein [Alphaproteobacteria bacterium]